MGVPKIAVMALVVIIAAPILLGFALNLTEETVTQYEPTGDKVNVTQLLQNGSQYTYTHGDLYSLNSITAIGPITNYGYKSLPVYESVGSVSSSLPLDQKIYTSNYPTLNGGNGTSIRSWDLFYLQANPGTNSGYVSVIYSYYDSDYGLTTMFTVDRVFSIYYDKTSDHVTTLYFTDNTFTTLTTATGINVTDAGYRLGLSYTSYDGELYIESRDNNTATFVDPAAGYHFDYSTNDFYGASYLVFMPDQTKQFTLTVNLDSITDPNYTVNFDVYNSGYSYKLVKTTTGSDVSWQWMKSNGTDPVTLYYDPNRSDNTYQIYIHVEEEEFEIYGNTYYYALYVDFRYVGSWPTVMGPANYFQTYTKLVGRHVTAYNMSYFRLYGDNSGIDRTPTIRVDDAYYNAFQYPIVENQSYAPGDFKINPSTTISNVEIYGSSIEFAGQTYKVTNGNITLGTHQVSVNGLVFDSRPVLNGYDNRINGYVVSTTATPATMTFVGKWAADITTSSMAASTYTKTEWTPGQFGWDGIDTNFLIVGMFTSLAAFIGLGIYARKHGGGVIPLMIVCGGAAVLFFTMI